MRRDRVRRERRSRPVSKYDEGTSPDHPLAQAAVKEVGATITGPLKPPCGSPGCRESRIFLRRLLVGLNANISRRIWLPRVAAIGGPIRAVFDLAQDACKAGGGMSSPKSPK